MSQPLITSKADLMAVLGTTLTLPQLGLLEAVQREVEGQVRAYVRHMVTYQQHIDYLPLTGPSHSRSDWDSLTRSTSRFGSDVAVVQESHVLQLRNAWARTVTSVIHHSTGIWASGSTLDATSYRLDVDETWTRSGSEINISYSGRLLRNDGWWPAQQKSLKVTYYAGLHPDEIDDRFAGIKGAVTDEIVARFRRKKQVANSDATGPIRSESFDYYSVSYDGEGDSRSSVKLSKDCRKALAPWRLLAP